MSKNQNDVLNADVADKIIEAYAVNMDQCSTMTIEEFRQGVKHMMSLPYPKCTRIIKRCEMFESCGECYLDWLEDDDVENK